MSAVNNKQLQSLSEEYVHCHYRVCGKHFAKEDVDYKNSLKKTARPRLFLPTRISISLGTLMIFLPYLKEIAQYLITYIENNVVSNKNF
ncbi:hypothetical protein QE152_g18923 [Popillia japonica]|uniref:THAP-type domain-containing protein n=1 Tax=Popillia japonica TaxID=7064 RepID=A0AAW1L403_POPJA